MFTCFARVFKKHLPVILQFTVNWQYDSKNYKRGKKRDSGYYLYILDLARTQDEFDEFASAALRALIPPEVYDLSLLLTLIFQNAELFEILNYATLVRKIEKGSRNATS